MSLLLPFVFAVCRRLYGANKGDFKFNRLLCYALPIGIVIFSIFPFGSNILFKLLYITGIISAAYIGMSIPDYDNYWNLKSLKDWFMMSVNGLIVTFPIGLFLFACHKDISLLIAGSAGLIGLPIGYFIGWHIPTLNKKFLNKGPEWGEFVSWGLMGAAFAVAAITFDLLDNN